MTRRPTRQSYLLMALLLTSSQLLVDNAAAADTSPDDTGEGVSVAGSVTDDKGQPVAGARTTVIYRDLATNEQITTQTTGANGQYRFELTTRPSGDIAVVAWKKGFAFGLAERDAPFQGESLPPGAAVKLNIRLTEPKPLTLRIVDSDGAPAGGRLGVAALSFADGSAAFYSNQMTLDYLQRAIAEDGLVTLDYLSDSYGAGLLVETDNGLVQGFSVGRNRIADGATVKLLPPGQIDITLTSAGAPVRDRELIIHTRPERSSTPAAPAGPVAELTPFRGLAVVRTGENGTATANIATGVLSLQLTRIPGEKLFLEPSEPWTLEPGGQTGLDVKLVPGVKLQGFVLAEGDKPVAGVEIVLSGNPVRTGDDGRFEAYVQRGYFFGRVTRVPPGFVWPYDDYVRAPQPNPKQGEEAGKITLPVIRVKQATLVSGTVADENGKPVAGVNVRADWVQTHDVHSYFTLKSNVTQTDAAGRFRLRHVHSDADLRLTAWTRELATESALALHTDKPLEVDLRITANGRVRLKGSAMGSDGQVIPHAEIKVVRALVAPTGNTYGTRPVQWNDSKSFTADEQGKFMSPETLPRWGRYSVTISAPGYMSHESAFLTPPEAGTVFDLGEAQLTRARTVGGFVRDSSGQPVAGVTVWSHAAPVGRRRSSSERTQAVSDEQGRFVLQQLHPLAAVAIVKKDGYRTSGIPLVLGQQGAKVVLFRTDEPLPREQVVHPVKFDQKQRQAAAQQLLDYILPQQRASRFFHGVAIDMLARIDEETALAEAAQSNSSQTRAQAFAKLGEIEDAMSEAETIEDGYSRARARFTIVDHIDDQDQARELLATALLDARSIRRPDRRIYVIADVAERFAQLGDRKQAEKILRDEMPQAKALATGDWPGYARGSFAQSLARFDHETALKIVAEAPAEDQTRYLRNMAHRLAAIDPDAAETTLKRIGDNRYVDSPAVRVAYRMAPVDLPRAMRLLDQIDSTQRPAERSRGLAVIAFAIRQAEPERARELLEQAFAVLPEQRGGGGSRVDDITGTSILLVRFAEVIDPDRLNSYYWRAVANHPGPEGGAWSPDDADEENADRQAQLALLLSLYDPLPGIPQQVMEPVFEYWEGQIGAEPRRFSDREATFMAMALTNPQRASDWAVRFHEALDKELRRRIPQPWQLIGDTLTRDRTAIGKAITQEVYHRWVIDQFDF